MSAKDTRQRILDAAQRLIENDGLMRLTTKEIAREADCAEGTLFKHFKSKEDLCLAVVLENAPRFKKMLTEKRPGKGSVKRNLLDIALASVEFSKKLIPLGVLLLGDTRLLQRHRRVMRDPGRGPQEVFDLVAAYVVGEQGLGRLNPQVEPLSTAMLLFGPCFYWAFVRHAMGENLFSKRDQEFVAGVVESLLEGLSPAGRNFAETRASPNHKPGMAAATKRSHGALKRPK